MKKQRMISIFSFLFLISGLKAQYNLSNISFSRNVVYDWTFHNYKISDEETQRTDEQKFTYKNLRLYMLKGNREIRNQSKDMGHYMSLQDAVAKGKIKITEYEGGSVNTLQFENISLDTIMILAGEVVTGGKQDRVVGQDMVLVPKTGPVPVSVFCVEHGRWTSNGSGETFRGYFGVTTAAVRQKAVVDKNQSQVWSKVAEVNSKGGVNPSTGTYAAIANSDSLNAEVADYLQFFKNIVYSDSDYIGFVAVTGDSIIGCDLFASNALFRSHADALLKAAAIEASTNGSAVKIAASAVLAFLAEFLATDADQEQKVNEKGTMLKFRDKKLHMNYYKSGKSASEYKW